uniref:M polyprotein n=1 Tax=Rondonia orthonairovirus TaxID=2697641 RepID=A0A6B9SC31_9VIRU|nr:glycoprotein precursor [Rondonia orthonairovirus]
MLTYILLWMLLACYCQAADYSWPLEKSFVYGPVDVGGISCQLTTTHISCGDQLYEKGDNFVAYSRGWESYIKTHEYLISYQRVRQIQPSLPEQPPKDWDLRSFLFAFHLTRTLKATYNLDEDKIAWIFKQDSNISVNCPPACLGFCLAGNCISRSPGYLKGSLIPTIVCHCQYMTTGDYMLTKITDVTTKFKKLSYSSLETGYVADLPRVKTTELNCLNIMINDKPGNENVQLSVADSYNEFAYRNCKGSVVNGPCQIQISNDGSWKDVPTLNEPWTVVPAMQINLPRKHLLENDDCELLVTCLRAREGTMDFNGVREVDKKHYILEMKDIAVAGRHLLGEIAENHTGCYEYGIIRDSNFVLNRKGGTKDDHLTICNGTYVVDEARNEEAGCYTVNRVRTFSKCTESQSGEPCSVDPQLVSCGSTKCINLKQDRYGVVKLARGKTVVRTECKLTCKIPIPRDKGDIVISCSNGQQRFFEKNIVDLDCSLANVVGRGGLYICRMTARPGLLIAILVWFIAGSLILLIAGWLFMYIWIIVGRLIGKVRSRYSDGGSCPDCNAKYDNKIDRMLHRGNCRQNTCPYCGQKMPKTDLKEHTPVCPLRDERLRAMHERLTVGKVPKLFKVGAKFNIKWGKVFRKTSWTIILIIMIVFLFKPVQGQVWKDIWLKSKEVLQTCDFNCPIVDDRCSCRLRSHSNRYKRDANINTNVFGSVADSMGTAQLQTALNLNAPWGLVHIESTFSPAMAPSALQMSWESAEKRNDKIVLNGRSEARIQMKEKTGLVWELKNEQASETKKVVVSIVDFTQIYATSFQYMTGDRSLVISSHGSCTGPCPGECGCYSHTCVNREWPETRNWACNPSWCWGVGTGCTCCGASIERPFNKHAAIKWSTRYVKTEAVVCVEISHLERKCMLHEPGLIVKIGAVEVKFGEIENIVDKIPTEIVTVLEMGEDTHLIDFKHVTHLYSATNMCKLQSCTHGSPGDMQIYHPMDLLRHDEATYGWVAKADFKSVDTWMSWQGMVLGYTCHFGKWPTCSAAGIVQQNSEAFENLGNVEQSYMEDYFFHSLEVNGNFTHFTLDLKARPKANAGSMTVLVEVAGLQLHSKDVEMKGLKLAVKGCSGCFGCASGFKCNVRLSVEEPKSVSVHLTSTDQFVVLTSTSLLARRGGVDAEIRGFSPVQTRSSTCFTIAEASHCPTCPEHDIRPCVELELDPPKDILLENRTTLTTSAKEECKGGPSCWLESVKSFGAGIKSFFVGIFGSVWKGILTIVIIVLVILAFVYIGPSRIFCLNRCKKGRALARRHRGSVERSSKPSRVEFLEDGSSTDEEVDYDKKTGTYVLRDKPRGNPEEDGVFYRRKRKEK